MDYTSQIKERTDKINQNIKRNKELRKQQYIYNAAAVFTTLTAIANYFGGAIALEEKEQVAGIAMLAIAIASNLSAFYCLAQSNIKGKQAMQALMHNITTKAK